MKMKRLLAASALCHLAPGGSVRAAAGQNADWLPRALFPRQRC